MSNSINDYEWQQKLDDMGPGASIEALCLLVNEAGTDVPEPDVLMVEGLIYRKSVDDGSYY